MDLRADCFSLVIEKNDKLNNKVITSEMLENYFRQQQVIKFYAFILHDKDKKLDDDKNEVLLHEHYHLVILLNNCYSKKSVINDFADYLECNKNIISCRLGDIIESTLYLTHSECTGKFIYSTLDIHTNDITNLNSILSRQVTSYQLSVEYLTELVYKSKSLTEVYTILGLKNTKLYRQIVKDIYSERKGLKL